MTLGGIAEVFLGVRAEQTELEDIAKPLTVEDAEGESQSDQKGELVTAGQMFH
jgi:hypothetical protein